MKGTVLAGGHVLWHFGHMFGRVQIAVYSFAVKDNGRIAIWAGATLIIVSVVDVSIRVAVIFLTGFVQASKGEIDQGWLQQTIFRKSLGNYPHVYDRRCGSVAAVGRTFV